MSFTSINFILFLALVFIIYILCIQKYRWIVLLFSSVIFYSIFGIEKIFFLLASCFIAYIVSNAITKTYTSNDSGSNKKIAKRYLIFGLIGVIGLLLYAKLGKYFINLIADYKNIGAVNIIIPIGISYYTFGIISYMVDVYYKKDKAEKNFFKLLLYMIYFPQIIEGPIPRHKKLAPQLMAGVRADYKTFSFGAQRMLWGYLKKIVITDRLAIMTQHILSNYTSYGGLYFWLFIICSALQLYFDFSGCMDIVIGVSECFGIKLDENFNHPFFSETVAEFWRRWHITLGTWFKDYIYMPIVINPKLIKFSSVMTKKFGKKIGKNIMTIVPLTSVWVLTGFWHGTGWDYILWGLYYGLIIIISTVFSPQINKLNVFLNINTDSSWWHLFRKIRTFLFFCGGRLLTAPGNVQISKYMLKSMFTEYNPWILFDGTLYKLGLDRPNFLLLIVSIMLCLIIAIMQERGVKMRERIASYPLVIRWTVYYVAIFSLIIFGMYGVGYDASAFVYMKF